MFQTLAWIVICLLVGSAGSYVTMPEIQGWYQTIQKPVWNPPNWIFGPMWTCLYILMGIAAARVWNKRKQTSTGPAMMLFAVQLLVNAAWSFIFFGAHQIGLAFAECFLLWLLILLTAKAFSKIDPLAAALMLPYLCWVSFAAFLNFTIWQLNQYSGT